MMLISKYLKEMGSHCKYETFETLEEKHCQIAGLPVTSTPFLPPFFPATSNSLHSLSISLSTTVFKDVVGRQVPSENPRQDHRAPRCCSKS